MLYFLTRDTILFLFFLSEQNEIWYKHEIIMFCKLSVRALISGEHPEAMQTGSCGKSHSYYVVISLMMLLSLCNYLRKELFLLSSSTNCLKNKSSQHHARSATLKQQESRIHFKLQTKDKVFNQKDFQHLTKSWLSTEQQQQHQHQCRWNGIAS